MPCRAASRSATCSSRRRAACSRTPTCVAVIFALPENNPGARPVAVATDAAGNRAEATLDVQVQPRKFAEKKLAVTDDVPAAEGARAARAERDAAERQPRGRATCASIAICARRPRRASAISAPPAPRRRSGRRASCACPVRRSPASRTAAPTRTTAPSSTTRRTWVYDIASLKNAVVPAAQRRARRLRRPARHLRQRRHHRPRARVCSRCTGI